MFITINGENIKKSLRFKNAENPCGAWRKDRSKIINNYPKLQKEKEVNNYQQLTTIAMIMSGQQLFT